ncbi:MAG: hypothetical protein R2794_13120 [Chitinophagales bacterium]
MENTYLQKVLRSLNKAEWRSFGDYLASPFFTKNKKFLLFYQALEPLYPAFELGPEMKKRVYTHSTGSAVYNDASYRNLCSDLLDLALDFLSMTFMLKENTLEKQYRTLALLHKQILPLAERTMEKTRQELAKANPEALESLRTNIWLNDAHVLHSIYSNRKRINASNSVMMEDASYKIVTEYALVKIYISSLNYMKACRNAGMPIDAERIRVFVRLYETLAPFQNPVTRIYYHLVRLNVEKDMQDYVRAKEILHFAGTEIPMINQENIMIGLIDFVIAQIDKDEKWREELSFLYHKKLEEKMWNANKGLSYLSLFNAFLNEIILGRIEEAEKIVRTYHIDLHPDTGPSVLQLCEAWLLYMRGHAADAQILLAQMETENLFIKYSMRPLQCLIYFSLQEWDVLGSALESFRQFIAYNKDSIDNILTLQNANFCKYLTIVLKAGPNLPKESKKIIAQIQQDENIYLKKILLQIVSNTMVGN